MSKANKRVYNLVILDESGSMAVIKESVIKGLNEIIQTIKGVQQQFPEQQYFISLVSFNGLGRKTLHWNEPVALIQQINAMNYTPDASTPLFDAMGYSLTRQYTELQSDNNCHVLVTVFTDGEENASIEFNAKAIKEIIERLKQGNWTFSYIGTDHDVTKLSQSISIDNVMMFEKSDKGLKELFSKEVAARINYSRKVDRSEDASNSYYK